MRSFTPGARADLTSLYGYTAERSGEERALSYVGRIEAACERLAFLPRRGARRDNIRPGLRLLAVERRTVIAFHLGGGAVFINRVLHGGRDLGGAFPDASPGQYSN